MPLVRRVDPIVIDRKRFTCLNAIENSNACIGAGIPIVQKWMSQSIAL